MKILNIKNNKNFFVDITKTLIIPTLIGVLFIIWAIHLFHYSILIYPIIFILFILIYVLSGPVFGGVLVAFAISTGFFAISVVPGSYNKILLICENIWLILVFLKIEKFREKWLAARLKLKVDHEVLDRDITLIQSSISNNEQKIKAINQKAKYFQTFEQIISSIETISDEKELISEMEKLTKNFIIKGSWSIQKNFYKNIFVNYTKFNKVPLLITNTKEDTRFSPEDYKDLVSIIVIPIEVDNAHFGYIKGISTNEKEKFNDYDLRLLSILASLFGIILNNNLMLKKIKDLAITDGLTGLYTKNYFIERFTEEFKRAKNNNIPISIAMIDIDHFKKVNDTYGHLAGDTLLRQIANILRRRFRSTDIIARYGGEEFTILMLHTTLSESFTILDEVRKMVEKEKFFLPIESYQPIQIQKTISIGVSDLSNEENILEMIQKADDALYEAKNSGRNKICIYKKTR